MNQNAVTGLVMGLVLAILVFGLIIFGAQKDVTGETIRDFENDSESPEDQIEGVIIEMSSEGFSPESITIGQGETVTFVNMGTIRHWPASDIHPTHEIYSEFDSRKGILPGENWSFTFDKEGNWEYHDHLYPFLRGTIEVTG